MKYAIESAPVKPARYKVRFVSSDLSEYGNVHARNTTTQTTGKTQTGQESGHTRKTNGSDNVDVKLGIPPAKVRHAPTATIAAPRPREANGTRAVMFAERYRPAALGGGATGAPAAGVPLAGVCSGGWLAGLFSDRNSTIAWQSR